MKTIYIIIFLIFTAFIAFSQEDENEILFLAEESVYEENFEFALKLYLEILAENPNDSEINFKTGYCYLNIHNQKDKAIPYLEKALTNYDKQKDNVITPVELYFYLGQAYHVNGEYVKAIEYLNKAKEFAIALKANQAKEIILQKTFMCKNAIDLVANPVNVIVEQLDNSVNSEFNEIAPLLNDKENILYFTSNYDNDLEDDNYIFYKNLFYSENKSGNWQSPVVQNNVNNFETDKIPCAITNDNMFILLNIGNDFYISNIDNKTIQAPEIIEGEINSKFPEYYATYAYNNRAIIFSSDRRKGLGGKDLYIAFKDENGQWSKAENMGPSVNSEYNEDCPFFYQDSILFFSSDGITSMGGYDIVYTILNKDSTWSNIINLGYPCNSEEDELSFSMMTSGKNGYFTSNRKGTLGKFDIFSVEFDREDINYFTLTGSVSPSNVTGSVSIYDDNLNLLYADVNISEYGEFSSLLAKNNPYFLSFAVDGFYPVVRTIESANTQKDSLDFKEMLLQYVGVYNLYSLSLNNNALDFKGQLIVENLKKITEKSLSFDLNCNLNNILIAENIKRQLITNGFTEENVNINSFYETLENEIIIEVSNLAENPFVALKTQNVHDNLNIADTDTDVITSYSNTEGNFTIQVGAFSKNVNTASFKNLKNVKIYYGKDGYTRVTVGDYETEQDAQSEISKIKAYGFNEAFVRPLSFYTN